MATSFVQMFNQLKIIHCMCPKCDNIMRVSDLQIRSKEKVEKTWLDVYETKEKSLDKKEENYVEKEEELREEARKRGRKQVPKLVNQAIDKNFLKFKYDPYDVKAILHPIDFVVFEGMNQGQVENVTLLTRKIENPQLKKIHKAIAEAIKNKSYDWKVLRVARDGEIEYK